MTLGECKTYLKKTMGYYTPTRADFTKTYHSPPKIHGLSIESVGFGWSPWKLHEDSMETCGGLSNTVGYDDENYDGG